MKTFNIIACVIILLLAMASAVFSYFLYEKRVEFVDGWKQMSQAIQTSAEKIDEEGTTKYAKKLTVKELSHENYDQAKMQSQLKNLTSQSKEFVEQYKKAAAVLSQNAQYRATVLKKGSDAAELTLDDKTISPEVFNEKLEKFTAQNRELVDAHGKLVKDHKAMTSDRDRWKQNYETASRELAQTKRELALISQQRNQMAKYLATIGNRVNADAGSEKDFAAVNTYAARLDRVSKAVDNLVKNRDTMIKEMERLSGLKLNSTEILANPRKGLSAFESRFNSHRIARQKYAGAIAAIAASLKVSFRDDIAKDYSSTEAVVKANNAELKKIPDLQKQLANAQRNIGNLNTDVSKRDKEIGRLNGVITDYKTILSLTPGDADPKPWGNGSVDARAEVVGKVVKVSDKYGYVVLNIGSDSTVTQTVGNKKLLFNPNLGSGLTFNVSRDGRFVATVTISNVGKSESTAHIPADKAGSVKVGDTVTFKK